MNAELIPTGANIKRFLSATEQEFVSFCSISGRVGLAPFLTQLEYHHCLPKTPLGFDLSITSMKWPDDSVKWLILTIPKGYKELAVKIAAKHMLLIEPVLRGFRTSEGGPIFPLIGPNIFMIESGRGSAEYGTSEQRKAALIREADFCKLLKARSRLHCGDVRPAPSICDSAAAGARYSRTIVGAPEKTSSRPATTTLSNEGEGMIGSSITRGARDGIIGVSITLGSILAAVVVFYLLLSSLR